MGVDDMKEIGLMRIRRAWLIGLVALVIASPCLAVTVSGRVFFDKDNDGAMSPGENAIAGVAVSDGRLVVVTPASGEYRLETEPGRIVFVSLPRGYRAAESFYKAIETDTTLDFPLRQWIASRADSVRFAQITDIHVTDHATVRTLVEDLDEINSLDPGAEFVLATGDLVNNGKNVPEFDNYARGIRTSRLPVFNVPGNHDASNAESMANYRRILGPEYYSFNVGNCHLVVVNSMAFDDAQKAWIAKDLALAPKGSRRIFAMHYLPTEAQMDYLDSVGASAILSGHWHGDRARQSGGVLDLNTPPLRFGGIDRTARSFRIVDVAGDEVTSELRFGGFKHHAVVVSPSGSPSPRNGKLQVVVNAYDSCAKVTSVECAIGNRRVRLKRASAWSWVGEIAASKDFETPQHVIAEIRDTKGDRWGAEADFQLGKALTGEHPVLSLVAVAPTGGFITLSSPQAQDGMVAIGVNDTGDLKDSGVRVFDEGLSNEWHFHTDSAIKNNVAISPKGIYATSVAGRLYGLDRMNGKPRWSVDLDPERERWETAATTVADGFVYVGGVSYIAAFEEELGLPMWSTTLAKSDWWPSGNVIPTVVDGRLLMMTRVGAHAFDAKKGNPLWGIPGRFNGCAPSGDFVYTIKDDLPASVDPAAGTVVWTGTDKVGDTASGPAVSGDKMVVGTADGRVCAYSTKDGALIWSFITGPSLSSLQPYKRGLSDVNSTPTIADGKVYIGASDGVLYALSLATGERLDSYNIGSPIASSPLVYAGRLYVGAYDGNLYAFDIVR